MWDEIQEFLPQNLATRRCRGSRTSETRETKLGPLRALSFDFTWDGPRPGHYGGDHVRIVWAMSYTTMFHVYHHCSGDEWEARLPELEAVLASFELLKQSEVDKEAARSAVAFAASRPRRRGRAGTGRDDGGAGRLRGRGRGGWAGCGRGRRAAAAATPDEPIAEPAGPLKVTRGGARRGTGGEVVRREEHHQTVRANSTGCSDGWSILWWCQGSRNARHTLAPRGSGEDMPVADVA